MTEDEWATSLDPMRMLAHLQVDPDSPQALRFAVACCQRARGLLPEVCWEWASLAERAAEDESAMAEFQNVELFERVNDALYRASELPDGGLGGRSYAVQNVVAADWFHELPISNCPEWAAERAAQASLVRKMFTYSPADRSDKADAATDRGGE